MKTPFKSWSDEERVSIHCNNVSPWLSCMWWKKGKSYDQQHKKTCPLASLTTPHCVFFPKCMLAGTAPWHVYYGMMCMWCAVEGWCVACNSIILGFFLFQLPGNWQQLLTIQETPSMTLAQPLKDRWVISACTVEMHCTSRTFQNPHGQW